MKHMKSMLALVLSLVMALSLMAGCATTGTTEPAATETPATEEATETTADATGEVLGGWTIEPSQAAALPEDIAAVFSTAAGQWNGINLSCVALLGTQVVAGTNYAFLCESIVDDACTYLVAIAYQDLEGNVTLTSVSDLTMPTSSGEGGNDLAGGWTVSDTSYATMDEDSMVPIAKALEGWTGVAYTPIALLGAQLVAGSNYCYLASGVTVTADPVTSLYYVTVYEDLDNNCTISDIADFEIADYNLMNVEAPAEEATAEEATTATEAGPVILGGWENHVAPYATLSEDDQAVFDAVNDGMNCVALLATQVVAGTNYCFLAEDALGAPYLIVAYKDLSGNVSQTSVTAVDFTAETGSMEQGLEGGWAIAEETGSAITEEDAAPITKALEGLTGVGYEPIALLSTQLVSGTNYRYLCKGTLVTAEPTTSLYVIEVYEDLDGNCTISNIAEFNIVACIG